MPRKAALVHFAESIKDELEEVTGRTLNGLKALIDEASPYWQDLDEATKISWKEYAKAVPPDPEESTEEKAEIKARQNQRKRDKKFRERLLKHEAIQKGKDPRSVVPQTKSSNKGNRERMVQFKNQDTQEFYVTQDEFKLKRESDVTRCIFYVRSQQADQDVSLDDDELPFDRKHLILSVAPRFSLQNSLEFAPAEVALGVWTFEEGLIDCKNWILKPIEGMTPEQEQNAKILEGRHKIPVQVTANDDEFTMTGANQLITEFNEFISEHFDEEEPLLFASGGRENYNVVQGCLKWIHRQRFKEKEVEASGSFYSYENVTCLESLVQACNGGASTAVRPIRLSVAAAGRAWPNFMCPFHQQNNPRGVEGCPFAAVQVLTRHLFELLSVKLELDLDQCLPQLAREREVPEPTEEVQEGQFEVVVESELRSPPRPIQKRRTDEPRPKDDVKVELFPNDVVPSSTPVSKTEERNVIPKPTPVKRGGGRGQGVLEMMSLTAPGGIHSPRSTESFAQQQSLQFQNGIDAWAQPQSSSRDLGNVAGPSHFPQGFAAAATTPEMTSERLRKLKEMGMGRGTLV